MEHQEPPAPRETQFFDMHDDNLRDVFGHLSIDSLLSLELVDKRCQRLAKEVARSITVLSFDKGHFKCREVAGRQVCIRKSLSKMLSRQALTNSKFAVLLAKRCPSITKLGLDLDEELRVCGGFGRDFIHGIVWNAFQMDIDSASALRYAQALDSAFKLKSLTVTSLTANESTWIELFEHSLNVEELSIMYGSGTLTNRVARVLEERNGRGANRIRVLIMLTRVIVTAGQQLEAYRDWVAMVNASPEIRVLTMTPCPRNRELDSHNGFAKATFATGHYEALRTVLDQFQVPGGLETFCLGTVSKALKCIASTIGLHITTLEVHRKTRHMDSSQISIDGRFENLRNLFVQNVCSLFESLNVHSFPHLEVVRWVLNGTPANHLGDLPGLLEFLATKGSNLTHLQLTYFDVELRSIINVIKAIPLNCPKLVELEVCGMPLELEENAEYNVVYAEEEPTVEDILAILRLPNLKVFYLNHECIHNLDSGVQIALACLASNDAALKPLFTLNA